MASEVAPAGGLARERSAQFRGERHLTILMGARLALAIAALVIAVGLDRLGGNLTITEWHGFYAAVVVAFAATLVYRLFAGRIHRIRPFAIANIVLDLCLVSGLVMFSGGSESVFTFLYVLVPVYAAVLLSGRGAFACAALAGIAYAAVLGIERSGLLGSVPSPDFDAVLVMRWGVHTGAVVLVAALASFLVGELERADEALDRRTSDLAQLRTLHQRTVESLMSGLLTTDVEGRVTSFNREAERITTWSREEARGRHLDEILPGLAVMLEEASQGCRARVRCTPRPGVDLHLGVGAYVLRDAQGMAEGYVMIFQDVSQVVAMEQELTRSARLAAVGALSASIAHEIRNPLAAISGAIQMLRKDESVAGSQRLMDIAVREVERLNQLITDFLAYARPAPLQREPVSLEGVITEVVRMLRVGAGEGLQVSTHVDEGLQAYADAGALRQVIWNLVRNAAEAMADGGSLLVEATRTAPAQGPDSAGRMEEEGKSHWVEIAVLDQGDGVAPEIAERMFDPFFTTKRNGSGLGLPTVHRIVEEHGGSIRIERGEPPWSTAVRIRLPGVAA